MSHKNGKTQVLEFNFYQPKEKQTIGQIIHNSKDGTYFGRTPSSWAKIMLFYGVFYIVLAGLFSICMQGLFSTLKDNEPKWKLDESLIGSNPGMGFRPLPEDVKAGSLIEFHKKKPKEGQYWVQLMNDFFESYNQTSTNERHCSFNQTHTDEQVCVVGVNDFGPCSASEEYGYKHGRPCVFVKLNKIYGWKPEYYDNPQDLPDDMEKELKWHIGNTTQLERQQVWVSCKGHYGKDKERVGDFKYYPSQGFPAYYYPFQNQQNYKSPLIAIQIDKFVLNELLNIECRAWAKNIVYSGSQRDRKGSVTFELQVNDK